MRNLTRREKGLEPARFTKLQKLATRRNYCFYLIYMMKAQLKFFKRFGVSTAGMERALDSLYWQCDIHYHKERESL